jgi:hypothetical protein
MRAGGLASRARKQDIMNFTELAVVYGCTLSSCIHLGWIGTVIGVVLIAGAMAYRWWRNRGT